MRVCVEVRCSKSVLNSVHMFHIQGKTGAPGFLGNDGLPVSKPLLYIFNKSEKDAYSLQLNDMLMLFCQMN